MGLLIREMLGFSPSVTTLAESLFGEERHKLCEDCFALVHSLRDVLMVTRL